MSCPLRLALINSSRTPKDLEAQVLITLQDIRRSLFAQAQVATQSASCQMRIVTCGTPSWIFLSADTRAIELDLVDILVNYPSFPMGGRGLHDVGNGKIILCRDKWCRETLIHETLHSVSFTNVRRDLARHYLNLFEGLTEFFTGYVMFRNYADCYDAWKEERYEVCSVTYISSVRLWATFCRFIPISQLSKIYFWDGTRNWEAKYSKFLQAIHQTGYPNFGDFRREPTPTIETRILEECLRNFGRTEFLRIYRSSLTEVLDFTEMLP